MKKLLSFLCILCMLLSGCGVKCSVTFNQKSIKDMIGSVEPTEVKMNAPFTVGELEVNVKDVKIVADANNQGPSTYHLIVGLSAINKGDGLCNMSDAIEISAYSNDLRILYMDVSSDFSGLMGAGQQLLKDMKIKSGKEIYGVVPFSINDGYNTGKIKIYMLISNQLFLLMQ